MSTNNSRPYIIIDYRFLSSWVKPPTRRRKRTLPFSPVVESRYPRCMAILLRRLSWHYLAPRTISSSNNQSLI
ncbi:hypothetical protein BJY04DRAFT_182537 [Aspergillus karnatakaensis]|uniref:uncharacterized protein n=1 Tax=Aspergillus karnatakaensis TaxID=1810916 RepID=UPI003CCE394D